MVVDLESEDEVGYRRTCRIGCSEAVNSCARQSGDRPSDSPGDGTPEMTRSLTYAELAEALGSDDRFRVVVSDEALFRQDPADSADNPVHALIARLEAQLAEKMARVARLEGKHAGKDEALIEARADAAALALAIARARAEAAQSTADDAVGTLEALPEQIEAGLAENQRRPFWERVFSGHASSR